MITLDDWGETHCTYTTCSREFCDGDICYAGLYQCPHITEYAKALLPDAKNNLEEYKRSHQNKNSDEYYMDLAELESKVKKYEKLANK